MADDAASPSFALKSCKYDVFISFRGKDTRNNFISHLYAALRRKSIEAYKDDVSIPRGEEISPALLKAIEESKISIVVFSENYVTSRWCLDELVHILKCKTENGQIVLPVFYAVDPSQVQKPKESYASAFAAHEHRFTDDVGKVMEWRSALEEAGNLSGWDSRQSRSESELVEEIVQVTLCKLHSISRTAGDELQSGLVGVEERFKKIEQVLCVDSPDVRIIGIWGMGGIGKTTLADYVKKRLASRFESCFSVVLSSEDEGGRLRQLNEKLFAKLLKDRDVDMDSSFKDDRLRRIKALVVLDNVDNDQLEVLVGDGVSRFGAGSRIILTSRDKRVLMERANYLYEVDTLDSDDAFKLFYQHAFRTDPSKIPGYVELSERVVAYAGGNPLALKVLGSHLHSRTIREWESALSKLKKAPHKKINDVLKISYDALDPREQSIFLDIACLLKGKDREFVEEILEDDSIICISVLIEKCLITIRDGELWMHDLIQEMAWDIVRQESKELGRRSRLWIAQDVYHVLKNNEGSKKIEGIYLDMSEIPKDRSAFYSTPTIFKNMRNLRFLEIFSYSLESTLKLKLDQGLEFLPNSLRYLCWPCYPSMSLPSNFEPQNLVRLEMSESKLEKLWDGVQYLGNLTCINLSSSKKLVELPDLHQAPKLKKINVAYCRSFYRFGKMPVNLKWLDMSATAIKEFVERCSESLPNSGKLKSLETLNLISFYAFTLYLAKLIHINIFFQFKLILT